MSSSARIFPIDDVAKQRLSTKLGRESAIIRFEDEPLLAALCTCIGLQFEIGRKDFDRLSPFFGVDVAAHAENPWLSEIIIKDGQFGIRFHLKSGGTLVPRHPDLRFILHPDSFDAAGEFTSVVIFPALVAAHYKSIGLELVIVRDWILNSALNLDDQTRVPYLEVNPWEIQNNIAWTQTQMLLNRQLAFFGTHDIVDHLFNADIGRLNHFQSLFQEVARVFQKTFSTPASSIPSQLKLSYLIGILLDDLAQPKWYGSRGHEYLTQLALSRLEKTPFTSSTSWLVPESFHKLIATLRDDANRLDLLTVGFTAFVHDLNTPA